MSISVKVERIPVFINPIDYWQIVKPSYISPERNESCLNGLCGVRVFVFFISSRAK